MSIHRSLCIPLPLGRLSQRISRISTHSSGALYPGFSPTTLGPTISSGTHRYAVASPSEVGWVGGWRGDAIAFRFQSPPVEPCMRLSGSKLSARTSTPLAWLVTFLKAVLRSRTVGFPESGSDLGSARHLSTRGYGDDGARLTDSGHRFPDFSALTVRAAPLRPWYRTKPAMAAFAAGVAVVLVVSGVLAPTYPSIQPARPAPLVTIQAVPAVDYAALPHHAI